MRHTCVGFAFTCSTSLSLSHSPSPLYGLLIGNVSHRVCSQHVLNNPHFLVSLKMLCTLHYSGKQDTIWTPSKDFTFLN